MNSLGNDRAVVKVTRSGLILDDAVYLFAPNASGYGVVQLHIANAIAHTRRKHGSVADESGWLASAIFAGILSGQRSIREGVGHEAPRPEECSISATPNSAWGATDEFVVDVSGERVGVRLWNDASRKLGKVGGWVSFVDFNNAAVTHARTGVFVPPIAPPGTGAPKRNARRPPSRKPNHHGRAEEHYKGDPLGVYLPPLAKWARPSKDPWSFRALSPHEASRIETKWTWKHPKLPWIFVVEQQRAGGFSALVHMVSLVGRYGAREETTVGPDGRVERGGWSVSGVPRGNAENVGQESAILVGHGATKEAAHRALASWYADVQRVREGNGA